MMHKNIEEVVEYLPGSFANQSLYMLYIGVCLEMRVELNPEDHPILKKLIAWSDKYG